MSKTIVVRSGVSMLLGLGLWLASSSPAGAGPATEQLRASIDRVIQVLQDPTLRSDAATKARRAAIRREADNIFDVRETARRALGTHWQGLGERERQEFVTLFADLLEHAYVAKIERYSGERIAYAGEVADGELVTVKTRFVTRQGSEIPIDYRMRRRGDRWLAYDIVIEGVSLVANYRAQFDKIIQTSSYADLVARMKSSQMVPAIPAGARRKDPAPRS
jgi:phospholipid transport system substrate-binding protein